MALRMGSRSSKGSFLTNINTMLGDFTTEALTNSQPQFHNNHELNKREELCAYSIYTYLFICIYTYVSMYILACIQIPS